MDVSLRDAMLPAAGSQDFWSDLKSLEISSLELHVQPDGTLPQLPPHNGELHTLSTVQGRRAVLQQLGAENVRATALLLGTDFSSDDAAAHIQWATDMAHAAAELGAPVIRIDTATRNRELSVEQIRDNFVRAIEKVLDGSADTGVDMGIENHGHISNRPDFLDAIFAAVPDARLGLTLDTGNFYWYGWPLSQLYSTLEHFAPRARHTHVKNINYPSEMVETQRPVGHEYGQRCCPLDEGNISIARVVEILRRAGYSRDLCIENESLGRYEQSERITILQRDADCLRAAIGAA